MKQTALLELGDHVTATPTGTAVFGYDIIMVLERQKSVVAEVLWCVVLIMVVWLLNGKRDVINMAWISQLQYDREGIQ